MEISDFVGYITISLISNTSIPQVRFQLIRPNIFFLTLEDRLRCYQLGGSIKWPGTVSLFPNGSSVFHFKKLKPQKWDEVYKSINESDFFIDTRKPWPANLLNKYFIRNDTCILTLEYNAAIYHHLHPGHYLMLEEFYLGRRYVKSLFSVPELPLEDLNNPVAPRGEPVSMRTRINLFVNFMRPNTVNWHLCTKGYGSTYNLGTVQGYFDLTKLKSKERIYIITSGIGIASSLFSILRILQEFRKTKLILLFHNKYAYQTLFDEDLATLQKIAIDRFSIHHLQHNETLYPEETKISEELLRNHGVDMYKGGENKNFFILSGRPDLIYVTRRIIKGLLYPDSYLYHYTGL